MIDTLHRIGVWVLALSLGGPAALHAKDLTCSFQARGLAMSFGSLDPSSGLNATAVLSAATLNSDNAGDCDKSITMTIDGDSGQNYSGSRRLKSSAGNAFIPYTIVGTPVSLPGPGNAKYTKFTFTGVIEWSAYADVPAGNYSDTVMISVTP